MSAMIEISSKFAARTQNLRIEICGEKKRNPYLGQREPRARLGAARPGSEDLVQKLARVAEIVARRGAPGGL